MKKTLDDLIFLGVIKETVEIGGHIWTLQTLTTEEQLEVTNATGNYTEYIAKLYSLTIEILIRSLKMVDDEPFTDRAETTEFIKQLQPIIVNKLYEEYNKMQEKQSKSLENIDEINKLVDDPFSRIRYKVMRATSALPTEDRVKKMNMVQWYWYYLNIAKDEEEVGIADNNKIEYLTYFINPEMAKMVVKNNGKEVNKSRVNESNTQYNDFFDEELKKALTESGMGENSFTELPSSDMAGDLNESEDDFLKRVMNYQFNNENFNQSQSFEKIDDEVDYFEYPDE